MNFNADAFANAFQFNMTEDDLTELMMSMSGTQSASYDNNLQQLGYADFSQPSSIFIYPKDFDNKEKVVDVLDHYNQKMEDEGKEGDLLYGHCRNDDVIGDHHYQYDQLCTDCICSNFPDRIIDHDWSYYLY